MSISAAALEAAYIPTPVNTVCVRMAEAEEFTMMDPLPPAVEAIAGIWVQIEKQRETEKRLKGRGSEAGRRCRRFGRWCERCA